MPIAINANKTWPYILNEDAEAYKTQTESGEKVLPPTVFHLRTLTNGERAEIEDLLVDVFNLEGLTPDKIQKLNSAESEADQIGAALEISDKRAMVRASRKAARIYCQYGIAGWERLFDEDGGEVRPKHEGRRLCNESLDVVLPYADELATAIQSKNRVDLDDLKKSVPAS